MPIEQLAVRYKKNVDSFGNCLNIPLKQIKKSWDRRRCNILSVLRNFDDQIQIINMKMER